MEDTCKDIKNWEEKIFWNHFQSIHFSQFLHGDFLQRLEIPEKFAKNIKKKLPKAVTFKGPSGVIWDVGVKANGDTLFFDVGWNTFVKDHSLVKNDFLIFKYNGISHFDVLIFDGKSLCEKPSCYFVRKCMHTVQAKRKMSESPDEIVHNSSRCGLESSPEKSINNDISERPSKKPINDVAASNNKKKIQSSGSGTWSIRPKRGLESKELTTFSGEGKVDRLETEYDDHTTMDGDVLGSLWHATGKRVATQVEKMNVFLKAQEALTNEGFMIAMKSTHVVGKVYMTIPTAWVAQYFPKENADLILRTNGCTWKTRFYYRRDQDRGGLSVVHERNPSSWM